MAPVLKTQCPGCHSSLKITPKDEPSKVRCPNCQASIKIPALGDLKSKSQSDDELLDADEYLLSDEDDAEDEYGDYDEATSGDDEYGDYSDDEYSYDGSDDYDDDQDDEYEEMLRKRRRQSARRKKNRKTREPEPEPASRMNRALIGGICLAFGTGIVGVMIWLFSGDDEPAGGAAAGAPVAEGNGGSGNSGTQGASDLGAGGKETTAPEVVFEKALAFVRDKAGALDEAERRTWHKKPGNEVSLNWDVAWDVPERVNDEDEIQKRIELSAKNAGISIGSHWSFLPRPEFGQNPVRVNMKTWQGDQLDGQRDAMSSAAELGYAMSGGMTPDGTMIGQLLRVRNSERHLYQHWVTIHEYDNTILKVIPNAKKMSFLTNDYILLATDGESEYEGENPAQIYADAARNRRLPHEVWFRDLTTDTDSPRIKVRHGGHWLLSPTQQFLVVIHPDEASAESLKDPTGPLFDGLPAKTEIAIYKTENAEKVAEGVYSNMTVGYTGRFSGDGKKLALHAGPNLAVIDMTTGKVLAKGGGFDLEPQVFRGTNWLAGDRFLLLDWIQLVDVETGISFGGFGKGSREPTAISDWLGGEYFRFANHQAYQRFPIEELISSAEAITKPEANLMATGKVQLQVEGVSFGSLEEATLREALIEAL